LTKDCWPEESFFEEDPMMKDGFETGLWFEEINSGKISYKILCHFLIAAC